MHLEGIFINFRSQGRGLDCRWGKFFNWPNPSCRTTDLGSTQPLTEMGARKIDNLTAICEPIV
jgi:hypothetical protein